MQRDTIVFGAIAGIIGNFVKEIITWGLYFSGFVQYTFVHIGADLLVSKQMTNPFTLATGFLADWTIAGLFGIVVLLIIRFTGSDYPVIKGVVLATMMYVLFYGALMSLNLTNVANAGPRTHFLMFFPHAGLGLVTGWVIKRYDLPNLNAHGR